MAAEIDELKLKNSTMKKPKKTENEEWQISTWTHRAWLATGCAAVLFSIAKSIHLLNLHAPTNPRPWVESVLAAFIAYILADLGSGIYHWAIDNYGGPNTPIFGSQIVGFQGHHQQPWVITRKQLANNLYLTAASVAAFVIPINMLSSYPPLLAFVGVFGASEIFSQQFHAWAHTPRRTLPPAVAALQDAGILLAPSQHAAHHRPPYDNNYCIVSGVWNGVLDRSRFFLGLEMVFYRVFGYRPRSWGEPNS
ncbi:hypothetical protein CASFOL_014921 [Castilleja foliolosa]|uniref:Lipid desaturase domain-containing protein n=1 Tax=Castilleja foliolosa TaxID=1961234 RepID=A0ABD3DCN2_9LAMI